MQLLFSASLPPCLGCSYLCCPYKNHRCVAGGTGMNCYAHCSLFPPHTALLYRCSQPNESYSRRNRLRAYETFTILGTPLREYTIALVIAQVGSSPLRLGTNTLQKIQQVWFPLRCCRLRSSFRRQFYPHIQNQHHRTDF
jgi:hypothetical protein